MRELTLQTPSSKYMGEYLAFCHETWGHVHDSYIIHRPPPADSDPRHWSKEVLRECADGATNPAYATGSWVNHERFWAFSGNRMIAALDFRRRLTPRMELYGGHWGIAIRPSERGRGWSTKLLPHLLEASAARGVPEILLTTKAQNLAARQGLEHAPYLVKKDEIPITLNGVAETSCRYWLRLP